MHLADIQTTIPWADTPTDDSRKANKNGAGNTAPDPCCTCSRRRGCTVECEAFKQYALRGKFDLADVGL